MTLLQADKKIDEKYGHIITPYMILFRAVQIPEVKTDFETILKLTTKKLKDDNTEDEIIKISKELYKRYRMPLSIKRLNYEKYI